MYDLIISALFFRVEKLQNYIKGLEIVYCGGLRVILCRKLPQSQYMFEHCTLIRMEGKFWGLGGFEEALKERKSEEHRGESKKLNNGLIQTLPRGIMKIF